jgi:hypothetical protein
LPLDVRQQVHHLLPVGGIIGIVELTVDVVDVEGVRDDLRIDGSERIEPQV